MNMFDSSPLTRSNRDLAIFFERYCRLIPAHAEQPLQDFQRININIALVGKVTTYGAVAHQD